MGEIFIFNSKLQKFKKPFGAIRSGEILNLSAYSLSTEIKSVEVIFISSYTGHRKAIPMEWLSKKREYDVLSCSASFEKPDVFQYFFKLENHNGKTFYYGKDGIKENEEFLTKFQLTVYSKNYSTPSWFSDGVTYHIFVDRFFRGEESQPKKDDFFYIHKSTAETPTYLPNENGVIENRDIYGGDLKGIIKKLPYLESLGVKTLYLSPVFEAWSNHKYNTADYKKIDSHFGNEKILEELCFSAAKKGMRVVLDGVFSHTGSDSIYFNREGRYGENSGAWRDTFSPYREWYNIDENGRFSSWWGIDTLPEVNELNPGYIDYIIKDDDSVISHWMKKGISGWRLDVADELPDEFIHLLRKRAREGKPESLVIGEVWEDATTKAAYGVNKKYFTEEILDGVMNYPFKNAVFDFLCGRADAEVFAERILSLLENYPEPSQSCLMNIIGTHDTVRAINELSVGSMYEVSRDTRAEYKLNAEQRALGLRRLRQAALLQYIFPGSPCIYYGDEIGMEGFEDPFNRRFFTWDDIDCELLSFYRNLGKIKCDHLSSDRGQLNVNYAKGDFLILSRGKLFALVNRGKNKKLFNFCKKGNVLLKSGSVLINGKKLLLSEFSSCIISFK